MSGLPPSTPAPVRLAVCADDYGLHEGIDEAVLQLLAAGRLSAVSCLVHGPGWREGAAALRQAPAAVGRHLNFNAARPGAGPVFPRGGRVARAWLRRLDAQAVAASIEQQLDLFEGALGRPPDFVDGHQHVHQLPVIREALLVALQRRHAARPWLRCTARPANGRGLEARDRRKAALIAALGARGLARAAARAGFGMNRALLGVYGFEGGPGAYRARLAAWLAEARSGDLLVCHPSVGVWPGDPIGAARAWEFEVLRSPGFERRLREQRVVVARLSAMARG
jgi:predicted glycoside hydrolase/deacetylase ChbG (UPF0249 family)